jgi:hypothetical protein
VGRAKLTREESLRLLHEQLKVAAADAMQDATYENGMTHKAWLEGRASAYSDAATSLGRIIT